MEQQLVATWGLYIQTECLFTVHPHLDLYDLRDFFVSRFAYWPKSKCIFSLMKGLLRLGHHRL